MREFVKLVGVCFVTLFIAGCSGDIDTFIEDPVDGAMTEFLENIQTFSTPSTINVNEDNFIETDYGTIIQIPKDAFVFENNDLVTGDIQFEVLEIKNKSLLAIYEITTTTNSNLLDTKVTYHFRASQNDQKLTLSDKKIKIFTKDQNVSPEADMYGIGGKNLTNVWQKDFEHLVTTDNWNVTNPLTGQNWSDFGYILEVGSLGWKTCANSILNGTDNVEKICATIPSELSSNEANTKVYVAFKNYDTVMELTSIDGSNIYCTTLGTIPNGEDITFVVISALNSDNYYIDTYTTTTTEGLNIKLLPERKNKEQILDILEML